MATEQATKAVESGVKKSADTGESIKALARTVMEALQATSQISASNREQLSGMEQVTLAMENIKQTSLQNLDSMNQVEATMQNLHDLGPRLKQTVDIYSL